ncbi:hypothetical protein ACH5RR_009349 [Cinchona calisaya]|uniref:ATP-dependent DNA helicase n=1 Tax=Cinchona calisaya TaxID=153742 RepID=A0ABD3AHE3_9GENT
MIVSGVVHSTFKSACMELNLLNDDNEWNAALTEAFTWALGSNLQNMYCIMLMFLEITNSVDLWERHWKSLTDDLLYQLRVQIRDNALILEDSELQILGLVEIECILKKNGRSLKQFSLMSILTYQAMDMMANRLIREELAYNCELELDLFNCLYSELNHDQLKVYATIMDVLTSNSGGLFFVYGSDGIGRHTYGGP